MFMHGGARPFWPAIVVFLPWLFLGATYLLFAVRQRVRDSHSPRPRQLHAFSVLGLAFLAATQVANADPAAGESRASVACEGTTAQEARSLADRLYDKGEYQHAGECYQAAGEQARANVAFLKAAGPKTEDSAKGLKAQGDAAKALFAGVGRAFRGNH